VRYFSPSSSTLQSPFLVLLTARPAEIAGGSSGLLSITHTRWSLMYVFVISSLSNLSASRSSDQGTGSCSSGSFRFLLWLATVGLLRLDASADHWKQKGYDLEQTTVPAESCVWWHHAWLVFFWCSGPWSTWCEVQHSTYHCVFFMQFEYLWTTTVPKQIQFRGWLGMESICCSKADILPLLGLAGSWIELKLARISSFWRSAQQL